MRRGRGVTPPSVERSFGLQYYPTCLASSSRVKTCRGRRGARQGASSSHQEWGRAREDATRGRPEGVTGGSPLSKTLLGRPAEVNAAGDGAEMWDHQGLDSLTFSTLRGRRPPSSDALTGRPLRDAHPPTTHHENSLGDCGRSLVLGTNKHPRVTASARARRQPC